MMKYVCTFAMMVMFLEYLAAYKLEIDNIHKGEYSYSYSNNVGTIEENREGKKDENGDSVVTGSYTFIIDKTIYTVTYTADKNGYHPKISIADIPLVPQVAYALPGRAVASLLG